MKAAVSVALILLLAGCSHIPLLYRVPIVQGNVVSDDDVQQLELGMTRPQVRYVLGTPLVNSPFQQRRWDYVFYYRDPRGNTRDSQLSLFFEGGKLARIEGDSQFEAILPENRETLDPDDLPAPETRPVLPTDSEMSGS